METVFLSVFYKKPGMNPDIVEESEHVACPAEEEGWPIGCLQADLEGPINIPGGAESHPMRSPVKRV